MKRALAVAAIAAAVVGCNPVLPALESEQRSVIRVPTPDPPNSTCAWVGGGVVEPLQDRWNGQRGYVVYHLLTRFCDPASSGHYGVLGFDPTMSQVVWQTEVADLNGVQFYQQLPGTIPYHCHTPTPRQIDVGQVGTQDTDTGSGHCPHGTGCDVCWDRVCVTNDDIATQKAVCTPCAPLPAAQACANAGIACGATVSDGCANQVACTCHVGSHCDSGACVRNVVLHCPKGSYYDSDTGDCQSGLPQ
jgi:hypothetical protein